MYKRIAYLVSSLALLLLGIGIWRLNFSNGTPVLYDSSFNNSRIAPSQLANESVRQVASGSLSQQGRLASNQANIAPTKIATTESKTPSSAGAEVSEGDSVIGNPFPISASVRDSCKPNPDCDRIKAALKEMAQEARDDTWATDMEEKLREYSASFGPDKYTIRAIECRGSLCAIEVASIYSLLPPALPYNSVLGSQLKAWDAWTGHETDQLGAKITVTLSIYRQR